MQHQKNEGSADAIQDTQHQLEYGSVSAPSTKGMVLGRVSFWVMALGFIINMVGITGSIWTVAATFVIAFGLSLAAVIRSNTRSMMGWFTLTLCSLLIMIGISSLGK